MIYWKLFRDFFRVSCFTFLQSPLSIVNRTVKESSVRRSRSEIPSLLNSRRIRGMSADTTSTVISPEKDVFHPITSRTLPMIPALLCRI